MFARSLIANTTRRALQRRAFSGSPEEAKKETINWRKYSYSKWSHTIDVIFLKIFVVIKPLQTICESQEKDFLHCMYLNRTSDLSM